MAIDPTALYQSSSAPTTNGGPLFLDQYHAFVGALVDTAVLRLTNVAGTDAITATAEPFEVASTGLVAGMKFTLVPAADNTGAATLNIDGRGAESIVNGDGTGLNAGELTTGTRFLLEFDGTNFVIVFRSGTGSTAIADVTTYDTTTVWSNDFAANTIIKVELWGGGGGGYRNTSGVGGGGGAYAVDFFSASDLPSNVTITVATTSAEETDGGTSSFGSFLSAYGGQGGGSSITPDGAGGTPFGTGGATVAGDGPGGIYGGGDGGDEAQGQGGVHGGGGGGGATSGGSALSGGLSVYGGAGGDGDGSAGQTPGGGGGVDGGAGAAGRCVITVFGA